EFRHQFNWSLLSQSTKIKWTRELIDKYFLLWDFKSLSKNSSLPWTLSLVQRYAHYWDLKALKQNPIVKDLIKNSKVSNLGIEIAYFALGISEKQRLNENVNTKINHQQSLDNNLIEYNNDWTEYDNDYCSACMMTPCHCSDPDPG